ncbi:MAG: 2-amino-4-oxopentanoate thiolase subunit OrtA [Oscillospiraceae bacterium]
MKHANIGDWVQISNVVLPAGSRAPQVPADTQNCDLVMWVKGYAQSEANEGDTLEVITPTGRRETGALCDVDPSYTHSYGKFVPELLQVQHQLRDLMGFGGAR